jgi:hypothetical protein
MKLIALLILMTSICYGQMPPPGGGGGGGGSTNNPPPHIPKPLVLVDGLITNVALDRIDWCAWSANAYSVYHTGALTEPWTNIALEVSSHTHDNPTGFYKVCLEPYTAVFPIWNSGTSDIDWIATTDCTWLEFVSDIGLNVKPELGEGFLIVAIHNPPDTFEIAVITIQAGDSGEALTQSKQVTVVINSPW